MAKRAEESTQRKSSKKPDEFGRRKCAGCLDMFPTLEMVKIDGSYYCKPCGDKRLKEKETNKKLNDFLYNLCGKDNDAMPFLTHQVKQLKDYNGWKAESILATLEYVFNEDSDYQYIPEYGIVSIVERYYPIAKNYYIDKRDLKEKFPEEEVMRILSQPPRIITMKRSQLIKKEEEYAEKKKNIVYGPPIDMDDVLDERLDEEELDK